MKKIMVILAAIAFAGVAQASELWWTVGDSAVTELGEWDTAKLMANSGYWNYGTATGGTAIDSWSKSDLTTYGNAFTDLSSYDSSYSFYLEIYKGSELLGYSYVKDTGTHATSQGAVGYSELSANMGVDAFTGTTPSVYSFSNFSTTAVVPEPTSGLLMLLGLAGLALKRKRA